VDGGRVNNNDVGSNRTVLIYPSVEAIDEIKSTATRTGPSSAAGPGGRSTSSPARHERVPRQRLLLRPQDSLVSKNYFLEKANQPKQA